MEAEVSSGYGQRARVHRAMGDPHRLALVDALSLSDRTPGQLRQATGLSWNLLAFHLRVLEDAGVVARRVSEGDRRRRYVRLRADALDELANGGGSLPAGSMLFVCSGNAARSPFAAHLWRQRAGTPAWSAGARPAPAVHPLAVETAAGYGIDLGRVRPRGYEEVTEPYDVVVSVCDRAGEDALPPSREALHWSVPDPVAAGDRVAFEAAFADLVERVTRLAGQVAA